MKEHHGTQGTKHPPSVESTPPTPPPRPAVQVRGMQANSIGPSAGKGGVDRATPTAAASKEACSYNGSTCCTRDNTNALAADNGRAITAIGPTSRALPDDSLARRTNDPACPPSPPESFVTVVPDQPLQRGLRLPSQSSAGAGARISADLAKSSLQNTEEDGTYTSVQNTRQSENTALLPTRTCEPLSREARVDQPADPQPTVPVEQDHRKSERKSCPRSASSSSEHANLESLTRQFTRHSVMRQSLCAPASIHKSPTLHFAGESGNSAWYTVSAHAINGCCSHDATASVPVDCATASACSRSPVEAETFTNEHTRHRNKIDTTLADGTFVSGADETTFPTRETFPIPRYCLDDLLRGEDKIWAPGKPLRIAYISWNMASRRSRVGEVSAYCIHPNAHLVVVGTQENGPYLISNKLQRRWAKTVSQVCLGGQYELVGKHHMWAVQMLVFARRRDVVHYISRSHTAHVKTGLLNGLGGNKGGVAVGLVLSLTPKDIELSQQATTLRGPTTDSLTPLLEKVTSTTGDTPVKQAATSPLTVGSPMIPSSKNCFVVVPPKFSATGSVASYSPLLCGPRIVPDLDDEYGTPLDGRSLANGNSTPSLYNDEEGVLDDEGVFSPLGNDSRTASLDSFSERLEAHFAQRRRYQLDNGISQRQDGGSVDDDASNDGTPEKDTPNYMTLLFITAHLAAHQGAVRDRNKDYEQIVYGLRLGRRGRYRKFFNQLLERRKVLEGAEEEEEEEGIENNADDHWADTDYGEGVTPLRLPMVSAVAPNRKMRRDVTEEFDLTFFGGDLNYRINGTRKAIEYVIEHHRNIRSILINNDQLSLERARGKVFQGFQEGNLLFRPTYKYELSANGGVTLDEYNFSHKKNRMPAYCDRILYKKRVSSAAHRIAIRLYTDVPNVRSSDHRPVVALFDVSTRAYTD
ncbi:endonuclease/exonuclease/phosphatase, putative [Leishmania panamensis]|uniref:Endonuclease/exonuclease/phosphatase, putative n=1 Tax=Leishmania panamensis TaxID=5679 RepID=A0AC62A4Y8_LEIPA